MQYAVIVYETESELNRRHDPEQIGPYMAPYAAYWEALAEAGVAAGGSGLEHPDTATTIRVRGGERVIEDGPFADTKERLGGFFLIECDTEEEAIQWAAKCPSVETGSVELRPVMPDPEPAEA
ncbi:MAG: YciI family protein [Verrucomicrobiota bacterium]